MANESQATLDKKKDFCHLRVDEIVHFSFPVFKRATVDTEIVILSKPLNPGHTVVAKFAGDPEELKGAASSIDHSQDEWIAADGDVVNISVNDRSAPLLQRLSSLRYCYLTCWISMLESNLIKSAKEPPQMCKTVDDRPFDAIIHWIIHTGHAYAGAISAVIESLPLNPGF